MKTCNLFQDSEDEMRGKITALENEKAALMVKYDTEI
jgi:hypothetical protein